MRITAHPDPAGALREIAGYRLNYDPADTEGRGWHHDRVRHLLGDEEPGEPAPGGPFEIARGLVHDYEFAEPAIMRAYFHRDAPLVGRDMLLEGRFAVLRFPMGVRVDAEVDEVRDRADGTRERSWGWSYRTLEHHLERGRLLYEVVKNLDTGRVEFVITGVSSRAAIPNPVIALGFGVFGRWTQTRFYRAAGRRLARVVADVAAGADRPVPRGIGPDDLVVAPTD
ncbi:hypothetical protein Acsp06_28170 [Actinomycetospora sp. NBRC 106375]|uniref:DUF1990 family protein n=1 Tax=Actinomycetospora sp. NBRC 106375 TaxID=3032207 RepID=UPI00249F9F1D|nr:DUF1990 family protein [Actinomycetospora sp. NBRC 106375]GLZ46632.1 hypothetical protein Acsp06_28170 [Actinomycetospora sp. NBRC 106375]